MAIATLDGGGGVVDAYLVAALPGGVDAVEDHLAAAHGFGKDLDHAVGGGVNFLTSCCREDGGEQEYSCKEFSHGVCSG